MRPTTDTTDPDSDQFLDLTDDLDVDTTYAVVETDEDEMIVLQGTSQKEVDAKLRDFLTWAS